MPMNISIDGPFSGDLVGDWLIGMFVQIRTLAPLFHRTVMKYPVDFARLDVLRTRDDLMSIDVVFLSSVVTSSRAKLSPGS